MKEHSKGLEDIKTLIINLDQKLDRRVDALDQKIDSRVVALDQKISKYFLWIMGIQVTIFLSIIAVLLK